MKDYQRIWALAAGVLAAAVVSAAARADDSAALPVRVEPNDPHVRYVGRFDWRDAAGPRFAWSGCQIQFRFSGTAANALLLDSASGGPHPAGGSRNNYFNVIVDGGQPTVLALEKGRTVYRIAEGLSDGNHTVTLFRRTEPLFGPVQFLGLQLEAGRALAPLPPRAGRLIEFIGDSITCGYGNEGTDPKDPFRQQTENNYLAYGAMTARNFGAEYVCLAWSGQGVYRDRGGKDDKVLPVLYGRALPEDPNSPWDPNGYHPDAVVINLCTNDFAHSIPPKDGFMKAYRGLIATIRKHHGPQAHVFAAVGPMMYDGAPPPDGNGLTTVRAWLTEMVADYQGAGEKRVHYVEFDRPLPEHGRGSSYHPSVKTHQVMAAKLAEAIAKEMGWKAGGEAQSGTPLPQGRAEAELIRRLTELTGARDLDPNALSRLADRLVLRSDGNAVVVILLDSSGSMAAEDANTAMSGAERILKALTDARADPNLLPEVIVLSDGNAVADPNVPAYRVRVGGRLPE